MPVRSSSSSILKWPDAERVDRAARAWAADLVGGRSDVAAVAYLGSYARGDWGPGSDLDLLVLLDVERPPADRTAGLDVTGLPVPADLIVYTLDEWRRARAENRRFARVARDEGVWLHGAEHA